MRLAALFLALGCGLAQAQLGSSNARRIQGRAVQACSPSDGEVLAWSATNKRWECAAAATGSGGGTVTHTGGALTANQLVFGAGAADIAIGDLTGDVTTSGGKATAIGASKVTNGMLAGAIAAAKLVGTDIATVGTLTGGATGAGFTIALGTSTVTGTLSSANGGTGNGFTKFSGPASSEKTFTLPNADATLLYSGGALGTPSSATLTNATGLPFPAVLPGTNTGALVIGTGGSLGTSGSGAITATKLGSGSYVPVLASGTPSAAAGSDVVGLFSGCSGTLALLADGTCGASGTGTGTAPYSTTTITSSPMTITAVTHGQGLYAYPVCWDTSTPRVLLACGWTRTSNGDLVLTYTSPTPGMVDVFGATGGFANPLTTRGDLIFRNSTITTRLPIGAAATILSSDGTDVSWAAATGTGSPVRATTPTLTTPVLGAATGTSLVTTTIIGNNKSGGTLLTLPTNTGLYDFGSNARITAGSIANPAFFTSARWDGTVGTPTAIQSGDQLGGYNSFAYDGATLIGPLGSFRCVAAETHSVGAGGTYCEVATTPVTTTTLTAGMRWMATGGVTLPSSVSGGDKGAGTLNATGLYQAGNQVASSATSPISLTAGALSLLVNVDHSFTAAQTVTVAGVGATYGTPGLTLVNSTAATSGNQKYSPSLLLQGQGWKTNSTAGTQEVDWIVQTVPKQGTANPTSSLVFIPQINSGGYTNTHGVAFTSSCGVSTTVACISLYANDTVTGLGGAGGNEFNLIANSVDMMGIINTKIAVNGAAVFGFSSGAPGNNPAPTVGLGFVSSGVMEVNTGTLGTIGTLKSKYQSSDGSAGVTVTTCSGYKDGICISGT